MAEKPTLLQRLRAFSQSRGFLRVRRYAVSLPALIAAGLLALYALAGFFLAPYLLQREIPRFAETRLQAQASAAEVRVNPFLLTVEVRGFRLAERGQSPALAFDRLFVDFESSSLFRWAWTFADITLERPELNVDINPRGEVNLALLLDRMGKPEAKEAPREEPAPPRLLLRHAAVSGGGISVSDRSDPTPARARIEPVAFELKDISTLPDHRGAYTLSARIPAGGSLAWRGRLSLQPIASDGELSVKDLKLATVWRFLQDELRVEEPAGTLGLQLNYEVAYQGGQAQARASQIALHAGQLAVQPRGSDTRVLTLAEASLKGGAFDLAQRSFSFSELALRGGELALALDASGALNWKTLFVTEAPSPSSAPRETPQKAAAKPWHFAIDAVRIGEIALRFADATRVRPVAAEVGRADVGFTVKVDKGEDVTAVIDGLSADITKIGLREQDATEPLITLEAAKLEGGRLELGSRTASARALVLEGGATRVVRGADGALNLAQALAPRQSEPATDAPYSVAIDRIELAGHRISVADQEVQPPIAYDLDETRVKLAGVATGAKEPLRFEVGAKVKQGGSLRAAGSFDIARTRADARLEVSRLALAPLEPLLARYTTLKLGSGTASANGRFLWDPGRERGARQAYTGSAGLHDVLLNDAGGERIFACKSLAAERMQLDLRAARMAVNDLRLVAPSGKIVINKDRSTNLSAFVRKPQETAAATPAPQEPAAKQPFAVAIERVRVEGGELDFADLSLVLPFSTRIRELGGTVNGLSSAPDSRAGVKLEGQVEDYGLARIDGTISPFAPKTHTDLTVAFRNVMLPPLSPYTATFAGRRIASGRLSLDLQYKLNNSELQGENKILLQQFTLGERVESPSALDLPLDLAIALLTDSDGRIDVAIPVRGNVDHPEFSYGHLVWQAIRTLITRIVTAPFRALASLFGGSAETLDDIAFDPGGARLLPPEREKLVRLAETLSKRPQLKLLVQGRYNAERDGAALRETALRRAVAEKLGAKPGPQDDPGPVAFDNAKAQRALEALLAERGGDNAVREFVAAHEKRTGKEATRVNPVLALVGRASADRELYEAMYRRLIDLQPLPPTALPDLARQRSAVILKQLATTSGFDATRVGEKEPEAVAGKDVTAKLSLDVAKGSS